ncbi:MAG: DMT family transporter [Kiloniellales bacterium]|nr:DMT family transporter [Kiloniellales bacterium]
MTISSAGLGTNRTPQAVGIAVVVSAAISVSLSLVLARLVYDAGVSPATLITARMVVFALAVGLFFGLTGRSLSLSFADLRTSYGLGVINLIGTGGYLWSLAYIPVSLAVLIFYSYPLLTLLLTSLLERRAPRWSQLAALLFAFAGIFIALEAAISGLHPIGLALVSVGALGVATSLVLSAPVLARADTLRVTFHMALASVVVAGSLTLATDSLRLPGTGIDGWLVLAVTIATFVFAYFGMFQGVRMIGPVRTALILNLEPVATIGFAMLILSESLTPRQLVGAALVVIAITASQLADARRSRA